MGLFDFLTGRGRAPKSAVDAVYERMNDTIFPGGHDQVECESERVFSLAAGRLSRDQANTLLMQTKAFMCSSNHPSDATTLAYMLKSADLTEDLASPILEFIASTLTDGRMLADRALSLRRQRRFAEALSTLRRARRVAPGYWPAISVEANTLIEAGQPADAKALLLREIDAHQGDVQVMKAEWLAILGDIAWRHEAHAARARQWYTDALNEKKPEGLAEEAWAGVRCNIYLARAKLELTQGDYAKTRELARDAYDFNVASCDARRLYAMMTVVMYGDADPADVPADDLWEALRHLEAVFAERPEDYDAIALAGIAAAQLMFSTTCMDGELAAETCTRYQETLLGASERSEAAAGALQMFEKGMVTTMTHVVRRMGTGLQMSFEFAGRTLVARS